MKYFKAIILVFFFSSFTVFSQDNVLKHTIIKGETISSIAQKYNVSIAAIYDLNPKAKNTLQLNQVLIIPYVSSAKSTLVENSVLEKTTDVTHEVVPKETLYGIIKQYKTTTELLYKANPKLEIEGLKIGQNIIIPSALTKKEIASLSIAKPQEIAASTESLTHEVKAKESLYVIAKQYGITLKELQEANPNIGSKGLSVAQIITIPSNKKIVSTEVGTNNQLSKNNETTVDNNKAVAVVSKEVVVLKEAPIVESKTIISTPTTENKTTDEIATTEITHVVLTKETKFGIAKKYGITIAALEKQNPNIHQRLDVGSKLIIQVPNNSDLIPVKKEELVAVSKIVEKQETPNRTIGIDTTDLIDQLIQSASDNIGTRYRTGGTTAAGFDCSGLMCTTFGAFDIKLPRTSIEQSTFGEKLEGEKAQKGDLIFFRTNGRSRINHVGMVVDVIDDEIKFIHSSTSSGVIISSTKESYYQRHFAQVNRVLK